MVSHTTYRFFKVPKGAAFTYDEGRRYKGIIAIMSYEIKGDKLEIIKEKRGGERTLIAECIEVKREAEDFGYESDSKLISFERDEEDGGAEKDKKDEDKVDAAPEDSAAPAAASAGSKRISRQSSAASATSAGSKRARK